MFSGGSNIGKFAIVAVENPFYVAPEPTTEVNGEEPTISTKEEVKTTLSGEISTTTIIIAVVAAVAIVLLGLLIFLVYVLVQKKKNTSHNTVGPLDQERPKQPTSQDGRRAADQPNFKQSTLNRPEMNRHIKRDPVPAGTTSESDKHQKYYTYVTSSYASASSTSPNGTQFKDYKVPMTYEQFCKKMEKQGWN